jgi:hypothetical protein
MDNDETSILTPINLHTTLKMPRHRRQYFYGVQNFILKNRITFVKKMSTKGDHRTWLIN